MAELWPSRKTARPRNVPDWMVDRLDDYAAMSSGGAPSASDDLAELRRQQEAFHAARTDLDVRNSWMAIPALAPVVAVASLEATAAIVGRLAGSQLRHAAPFVLKTKDPYVRVGDNWATRIGRQAHKALEEKVKLKDGWEPNLENPTSEGVRKPDVSAPARNPKEPNRRYQMELKPNTPSGRRAAARAVEMYERLTGNKTRPLFYDPNDFKYFK